MGWNSRVHGFETSGLVSLWKKSVENGSWVEGDAPGSV